MTIQELLYKIAISVGKFLGWVCKCLLVATIGI
jgi:hypothetical protein